MKLPWMSIIFCSLFCFACAYRQGAPERSLPEGHPDVRVPMFRNLSQEVGIETSFTNAMIDELIQSRVAKLNPHSDVDVLGTIESVQYIPSAMVSERKIGEDQLAVATDYRIVIVMEVLLRKRSEDKVLWVNKFTGERTFSSARISTPVVSGANPLYNLSARRRNIAELAQDMVAEATDKMTENF